MRRALIDAGYWPGLMASLRRAMIAALAAPPPFGVIEPAARAPPPHEKRLKAS